MSEHDPTDPGRDCGHPVAPPKLRVPLAETPMVPRDRLLAPLDGSTTATAPPVTVVTGSAGAGKTTALAMWARGPAGHRVAWVTLDAHDNNPSYLWSAIREALLIALRPHEGTPDLPPSTAAARPDFPAEVIAALDHVTTPVHLVMDDAHVLHDRTALRGLEMLVRHTPKSLRLVLAGRHVPRLRLSRLRLEGRLRVLDDRDLAFTREEAEALFACHHLRLAPDDLDLVLRRTEGWTAGLRLAALSMAGTSSEPVAPSAFTGALPAVADYLAEEVLGPQDERARRLLVATSVCEAVSADLAAAVADEPEAGRLLQELSRTNALVSTVDGNEGWYRCHPLLRDHLSAQLDGTRPRDRPRLHHAAAVWLRDTGHPSAALRHAVRAENPALAAELVAEHGLREILRGNGTDLHELLRGMPRTHGPAVTLVAALAALESGDLPSADWLLGRIEDSPPKSAPLRTLHATARLHRARFHGDTAEPLRALTSTGTDHTGDAALDVAAGLERGIAELWRGNPDEAANLLRRTLEPAEREGLDHAVLRCLAHLSAAAAARGDTRALTDHATRALDLAADHGWQNVPVCALVYAVLAADAHRRLDDVAARHMASLAVRALPEHTDRTVALSVAAVDAITTFDDADDPHAVVSGLWKQWRASGHVSPHVLAEVMPTAERMALRVGEHQWAADMAAQVEAALGPCAEHALAQALLHTHRARPGHARKLIEPVLRGEAPTVAATTIVDVWVLEATLLDREDNTQQAHEALRKALAAAEPLQALRPFFNAGKPIRDLLARSAGRLGHLDRFATAVMTTVPTTSTGEPDGLTGRERALLVELPSMRTAEEIADSMFVSVNTVKTHLRGIYRKLGVSQRRDAVVVARQRGLI